MSIRQGLTKDYDGNLKKNNTINKKKTRFTQNLKTKGFLFTFFFLVQELYLLQVRERLNSLSKAS